MNQTTINFKPQPGKQFDFLASPADVVIYGGAAGSAKTYGLCLEMVRNYNNESANAICFRRTTPQIRNLGGILDETKKIFPYFNARLNDSRLEWNFPSNYKVKLAHLENEMDVENYQGAQIMLICFDELTHFTEYQFWYMLSRNRSLSGIPGYLRGTCNPDADSWVAKLISWWIDQDTGYPIPERSGVIRWFIRKDDVLYWADTKSELLKKFHYDKGIEPKSFTFISASIYDNKILLEKDPAYLGNLKALPLVERERLLGGNWKIRPTAGAYFKKLYFQVINEPAQEPKQYVRAWDLAGTELDNKKKNDPDYSVGLKVSKNYDGFFVVEDMVRFRESPHLTKLSIKNKAVQDGNSCLIRLPEDPGQAGKYQKEDLTKFLAGYALKFERPTGSKEVRASVASSQAEQGFIKVVKADWNDEFFKELENFPTGNHDDIVDALSDAINELKDHAIINSDLYSFSGGLTANKYE